MLYPGTSSSPLGPETRTLPEMAVVVPLVSRETESRVVSPRGLCVVVSWLDTFVETAEVNSWGVECVVIEVMFSIVVNPEAIKKQGGQVRIKIILESHDIMTSRISFWTGD